MDHAVVRGPSTVPDSPVKVSILTGKDWQLRTLTDDEAFAEVKVKKALNRGLRPNPFFSGPAGDCIPRQFGGTKDDQPTNVALGCLGPPS